MKKFVAKLLGQPLFRGVQKKYLPPSEKEIERVLRTLKSIMLRQLKGKLLQTAFSDRAKRALAKSIRIDVKQSSLTVTTSHPGFLPMVKGQKQGQMRWLVKSRAPIPIITETGELIFRSATPKSMADGKWIHPGREPSDYVEKARQQSRKLIKDRLRKELGGKLKIALAGRDR